MPEVWVPDVEPEEEEGPDEEPDVWVPDEEPEV